MKNENEDIKIPPYDDICRCYSKPKYLYKRKINLLESIYDNQLKEQLKKYIQEKNEKNELD